MKKYRYLTLSGLHSTNKVATLKTQARFSAICIDRHCIRLLGKRA